MRVFASRAETRAVVEEYKRVLDGIHREDLRTNVAIKPTHLGLALDEQLAFENVAALAAHAADHGNFVRMDMEESRYVDPTLAVYRRLRAVGRDNVGIVLQAYLYRTERDLEELLPLSPNVRICKGAYLERPEVAYPEKPDVDAAYFAAGRARAVERRLRRRRDARRADDRARDRVHPTRRIPPDRFQFQMLYGVRPQLQLSLVRRGYEVLVATPYGPDWYRYLMRRLAERPANIGFLLRNLVRG